MKRRKKSDLTDDRKIQHIAIIRKDRDTDRQKMYFDEIRLTHRALPEIALDEVDPSVTFLGRNLSFPLLISCMTGGTHDTVRKINRRLAEAAEAERVAMGVGSQRVMFTSAGARDSFSIRDSAPSIPLLANLGAVQLNKGFGLAEARAAVSIMNADALVFHLNPLQEAVQPEGDTDFHGLAAKIGVVARSLKPIPIIAKEVGAGISVADAKLLMKNGVRILDVAGSGGTSWSRIEHYRHQNPAHHQSGILFQDWGIPTPLALQSIRAAVPSATLIASGGIRSGLDMAKSVILGASMAGLAKPFLDAAMKSTGEVRAVIQRLRREFTTAMFLLGVATIADLKGRGDLILSSPWRT